MVTAGALYMPERLKAQLQMSVVLCRGHRFLRQAITVPDFRFRLFAWATIWRPLAAGTTDGSIAPLDKIPAMSFATTRGFLLGLVSYPAGQASGSALSSHYWIYYLEHIENICAAGGSGRGLPTRPARVPGRRPTGGYGAPDGPGSPSPPPRPSGASGAAGPAGGDGLPRSPWTRGNPSPRHGSPPREGRWAPWPRPTARRCDGRTGWHADPAHRLGSGGSGRAPPAFRWRKASQTAKASL